MLADEAKVVTVRGRVYLAAGRGCEPLSGK
jgi:hypothetical protein